PGTVTGQSNNTATFTVAGGIGSSAYLTMQVVEATSGCRASDSVLVTVNGVQIQAANSSIDVCLNDSVQMAAAIGVSISGGTQFVSGTPYNYTWSSTSIFVGITDSTDLNSYVRGLGPGGPYPVRLRATDSLGCFDTLTMFINVRPL